MKKLTVVVTQGDIRKAQRQRRDLRTYFPGSECPIAQSLFRRFRHRLPIIGVGLRYFRLHDQCYRMSAKAVEAVYRFDDTGRMKPFRFVATAA